MKSKKPSRAQMLSSCEELRPDDGVDPRYYFRKCARKGTNRKALQMCGEVFRTLSMVLAWESGDELLQSLGIESVEPAPDSTRVMVSVCVQAPASRCNFGEVLRGLNRSRSRLRTAVAAAIHRKRVPELVFRVVGRGEVRL